MARKLPGNEMKWSKRGSFISELAITFRRRLEGIQKHIKSTYLSAIKKTSGELDESRH
jgi:hypothetical protein